METLLDRLARFEQIPESDLIPVISAARDLLVNEPNVLRLSVPINVVGDLHGQFPDLLELFRAGGHMPETKYVFVGDFVDRGYDSVATISYLLVLKVLYPSRIWLTRGNHESRSISQVYGFYDEVLRKYGSPSLWRSFTELFDYLPIAACIGGKVFAVHAGLSPQISAIDEIESIERKQEIPNQGSYCDLLWSDPEEISGWSASPRGAGFMFGGDIVKAFNHKNSVDIIIRAHQLVMEGYRYMFKDKLATVWSAPNYCYRCGNTASILELDDSLNRKFRTFSEATDRPPASANVKKPIPEYFL